MSTGCDLLCIGPHTDDAEIALGGTLARLARAGQSAWIADLTRGELASNADPEERWREAAVAAKELGITGRVQFGLPDGFIDPGAAEQVGAVVWLLRSLRPRWVVSVPEPRRHPDHLATPSLVTRAVFLARLASFAVTEPDEVRWWPQAPSGAVAESWIPDVVATTCLPTEEPSLLVDVTDTWDRKLAALAAYPSQFARSEGRRPTHINDPDFLASIEDRARTWGRRGGVGLAEALKTSAVPVVTGLPEKGWR